VDFDIVRNEFFGGRYNQSSDIAYDTVGEYLAVSDNAQNPFYKVYSSGSRIRMFSTSGMRFGNAAWTAGDRVGNPGTTTDTPTGFDPLPAGAVTANGVLPDGDIDLSLPYTVTVEVTGLPEAAGTFQVLVDQNSTSGGGPSIHGSAAQLINLTAADGLAVGTLVINVPGDVTMNGTPIVAAEITQHVGTPTSFLAFRCPSNCGSVEAISAGETDETAETPTIGIEISGITVELQDGGVLQLPLSPFVAPTLAAGNEEIGVVANLMGNATGYDIGWSTTDDSATIGGNVMAGTVADVGDPPVSRVTGTITGLTNGTPYFVFVRAKNTAGDSNWGPSASATPVGDPPAAPAVPTVEAGPEQIRVDWVAVDGAAAYDVGWSITDDSATIDSADVIEDIVGTTTIISDLTPATEYFVFVLAKNASGSSAYSSPGASATPTAPVAGSWTGAALDIVGTGGTAPSGSLDKNNVTQVTITATGGSVNSSSRRHFFAYLPVTANDFTITARVKSITVNGDLVSEGNSSRFGMLLTDNITPGAASYAESGSFGSIGFYYNGTTLTGTRGQMKETDTQSRSNIAELEVGHWIRLEIFDDGVDKRIRQLMSTNGVDFTQLNSTVDFQADAGEDSWFWGFYAAPGANDLTIAFDNITITTP
jgi:hypothetical protein